MVLAGETLFAAGPHGQTAESQQAFEGDEGISLVAISAKSGAPLNRLELDSLPVFDGLIAARGRLFLSTQDGKVRCFE